ncbi:fluoride efflux transporter FluC [Cohnella abietis]|uniref:Fluoride-specific ion channel FluC n=1 Tax=Cohnella abietis TaxID=2507935 RepID=A0A3T1D920_9BACL|nr:CrcB family protein [Cohnella abietis]BBI34576.1 putative fluoride ion transporter CrcB [Cohnella abietis]
MSDIAVMALVGVGGAIGALLRYGIGRWVVKNRRPSYYGTLIVNLVGSFAIGVFLGLQFEQEHLMANRIAVVGLLGGFTTYSTLNVQKVTMRDRESKRTIGIYLAATYIGGFGLTALGVGLGYLLHT